MATVQYAFGSWVSSGPGDDLQPGNAHDWSQWGGGLGYGTANSVSAHPVQGGEEHILAVENVRLQTDGGGRRTFYTVRNVGQTAVSGYGVGYSFISQ
ncbi:MAG: hypothetical protein M3072_02780 [Candidatus Dormibacteraeota bacterium]|nr:hypothetical protein [Candidatus Dormibacteraeota bacterium]